VVGNLSTQRNAIRMLYDRILILVAYVEAVINSELSAVDFALMCRIRRAGQQHHASNSGSGHYFANYGCRGFPAGTLHSEDLTAAGFR
jgi:hypothetical protein